MTKTKPIKIIFLGTPKFAVPILEKLTKSKIIQPIAVITEPDMPAGRKRKLKPSPIKLLAKKLKLKILQPKKIAEISDQIQKINPDLAVVAAYGQIIPEKILKIPQKGFINIHPSLLPKFRGASPIQWTFLGGEKITGTTIMLMDKGMDTGPILIQKKIKVLPADNFITLSQKLSQLSAKILTKTIFDYWRNKIKPKKQIKSRATYTKIIKKENGLLNFTKPAKKLENQIKAFCVWPKSFCFWQKKRLIIHQAKAIQREPEPPAGAGVVFIDKNSNQLAILTGRGSLIIEKLQLEGKKKLNSQEFLNGYPQILGDVLKSKNG